MSITTLTRSASIKRGDTIQFQYTSGTGRLYKVAALVQSVRNGKANVIFATKKVTAVEDWVDLQDKTVIKLNPMHPLPEKGTEVVIINGDHRGKVGVVDDYDPKRDTYQGKIPVVVRTKHPGNPHKTLWVEEFNLQLAPQLIFDPRSEEEKLVAAPATNFSSYQWLDRAWNTKIRENYYSLEEYEVYQEWNKALTGEETLEEMEARWNELFGGEKELESHTTSESEESPQLLLTAEFNYGDDEGAIRRASECRQIVGEIRAGLERHKHDYYQWGEKLKHIKENVLRHGEFVPWLESKEWQFASWMGKRLSQYCLSMFCNATSVGLYKEDLDKLGLEPVEVRRLFGTKSNLKSGLLEEVASRLKALPDGEVLTKNNIQEIQERLKPQREKFRNTETGCYVCQNYEFDEQRGQRICRLYDSPLKSLQKDRELKAFDGSKFKVELGCANLLAKVMLVKSPMEATNASNTKEFHLILSNEIVSKLGEDFLEDEERILELLNDSASAIEKLRKNYEVQLEQMEAKVQLLNLELASHHHKADSESSSLGS